MQGSSNLVKLQTLWSNDYGRYLVAASDIPEGTVILLEDAMLHAPADDVKEKISGKTLLCLVCCCPTKRRCKSCGWSVCSKDCEKVQCHTNECHLFTNNGINFPPPHSSPILYKTILVLRCLQKMCDPRVWVDFLSKLEHHSHVRSTKSVCNKSDGLIIENIQHFYPFGECPFTEKEIRTVCGIINVNAFLAEKMDNVASWRAKCMFETASLFAHSCSPNCSWNIEFTPNTLQSHNERPKIQIEVITAALIQKGEMLSIFYSTRYALYGTLKRIVLMEEIAHFQCKCARCRDRTEVGTYMSAVKCSNCENDYILPEEPTDVHSNWKCLNSSCGHVESVTKIVCKVCEIEDYVEKLSELNLNVQDELKLLSTVVRKYSGIILHKNHYALQELSMRMIQLAVEDGILNVENISQIDSFKLEVFVTHCKYLLDIGHKLLFAMTGYIGTLENYLRDAEIVRLMIRD